MDETIPPVQCTYSLQMSGILVKYFTLSEISKLNVFGGLYFRRRELIYSIVFTAECQIHLIRGIL